jgi:valyl-tRNA synthetase
MRVGRRLAIKLLNASKFVLHNAGPTGPVTSAVDRGMLTRLARLVDEATTSLEDYDYTRVLDRLETFFWSFCDDYLELVKSRRYGDHGPAGAASANHAMQVALRTLLRLFAPYLPFAAEEIWSWWQRGSIHRAAWPTATEVLAPIDDFDAAGERALELATMVLGEIRRRKSEEQRPLRTPVARLWLRVPETERTLAESIRGDVAAAGFVEQLDVETAARREVAIELVPATPAPEPHA